jgi:methylmalonyl-CoA mutase
MSWTIRVENPTALARIISAAENFPDVAAKTLEAIQRIKNSTIPVGNYGNWWLRKISLVDELVRRFN